MGWIRKRAGDDGKPRYQANYRDARGNVRTAGTFATKRDAERAWLQRELLLSQGRLGAADTGKLSFARYVEDIWFPHHVLEPSTRESYRYVLGKHLLPSLGPLRMIDILPSHIREWVSERVEAGVSPATIRHSKIVLSAIFTTALNDQVTLLHPCKGVKTPTVPIKTFRIITPEQFERIFEAIPAGQLQLLVETAIDSGLRWGELTELRGQDLDDPRSLPLGIGSGRAADGSGAQWRYLAPRSRCESYCIGCEHDTVAIKGAQTGRVERIDTTVGGPAVGWSPDLHG